MSNKVGFYLGMTLTAVYTLVFVFRAAKAKAMYLTILLSIMAAGSILAMVALQKLKA